jgi:dCTP deaminase
MELLHSAEITRRMQLNDKFALYIEPLLDISQIGQVTIDLRLGTEFLVSILTRKSAISLSKENSEYRGVSSYFQPTRRELGDKFILYPHQVTLASTLEYVGLPCDVYADVLTRSSYTRLGVDVNTMVQPGYRGCFSVELFNHGNTPVELVVGSRIFQARLFGLGFNSEYNSGPISRKYFGNVRPTPSRAPEDLDLRRLEEIRERRFNQNIP